MKIRHNDKQKYNVTVTLFQYVMQTYHEKSNPKMMAQLTK